MIYAVEGRNFSFIEYLISQNHSSIKYIIVGLKDFSMCPFNEFSLFEINQIKEMVNSRGIKLIINIARILTDDELTVLNAIICELDDEGISYYMYSDMGVYMLLKELNLSNKTFYYSPTYLTSESDIANYLAYNARVCASSEISKDELRSIISDNTTIDAFGKNIIFYSRRPLISNYFKYMKSEHDVSCHQYLIKEELRSSKHQIIERTHDTLIYEENFYYLSDELTDYLDKNILLLIHLHDLTDESSKMIIESYLSFGTRMIDADALNERFKEFYKGAYDIESCLLKEESHNE